MIWMKKCRLAVVLMLIVLMLLSQCMGASANGIGSGKSGSLTIVSITQDSKKPLPGVDIEIYLIATTATMNPATYEKAGSFSKCPVELKGNLTSKEQAEAALILSNFVNRSKINPIDTAKTDKTGTVKFNDLNIGLYLIRMGDTEQIGDYVFQPFILTMPTGSSDGVNWEYTLTAEPKIMKLQSTPVPSATPSTDDPLPQTGMDYTVVYGLLSIGVLLVAVGCIGLVIGRHSKRR